MTTSPFPLNGHVYDIDQTAESGVTVKIINTRTGEVQTQVTDSLGEYVFDLANFTSEYNTNDMILVQSWKDGTPFKLFSTSVLVEGSSATKDLYLRPVLNKFLKQIDLKDMQMNSYQPEFGTNKTFYPEAERIDFTLNSDGFATIITEYINGVKKTTTITRNSSNDVTKIEVS